MSVISKYKTHYKLNLGAKVLTADNRMSALTMSLISRVQCTLNHTSYMQLFLNFKGKNNIELSVSPQNCLNPTCYIIRKPRRVAQDFYLIYCFNGIFIFIYCTLDSM
jgi:hypothetical protein